MAQLDVKTYNTSSPRGHTASALNVRASTLLTVTDSLGTGMNELPSDRLILQCIYDLYRGDPIGRLPWEDSAGAPIYKSIDSTRVARQLNADPGIIFGRLYYHLDHKYRYTQDDGSK